MSACSASAEAKPSELWGKTGLREGKVTHGKAQDVLNGLPNHLVELRSLVLPKMERGGTHEVDSHNAVAYA